MKNRRIVYRGVHARYRSEFIRSRRKDARVNRVGGIHRGGDDLTKDKGCLNPARMKT